MSVALFVTSESEASRLIPWGLRFARVNHTDLKIIFPRKSKGKEALLELGDLTDDASSLHKSVAATIDNLTCDDVALKHKVKSGEESSDHDRVMISLLEVVAPDPESEFVQHVRELDITLLIVPMFQPVRGKHDEKVEWEEKLFRKAPCGVVCIRGQISADNTPLNLLFASEKEEDQDDEFALDQTARLGRGTDGKVTLLYVRPADDIVAQHVAEKHVDQLEKSIKNRKLQIGKVVQLADNFVDGINKIELDGFDLVVVGTRSGKEIRQLLGHVKPSDESSVPLAIMRQAVPLRDKLWLGLKELVRSHVPQISREHRVNLVDRLSTSSNFDFDFIALISLSTLIAAVGLVQNSAAVVIGAMLVAPLMTPLVATGLALVQGNERLLRTGLISVFYGFAVALLIGVFVGGGVRLCDSNFAMGSELMGRGSPNILDLIVALASGVAAAYAMGRPNLLSALPGVAIAAALVPPIATSGVAFSMGYYGTAVGSLLLFLTNIVAIVLGTAMTFWAIGISTHPTENDQQRSVRHWPRYWFIGCVVLSILIAAEMLYFDSGKYNPPGEKKNPSPPTLELEGAQRKSAVDA